MLLLILNSAFINVFAQEGDTEFWFAAPNLNESTTCGSSAPPMMFMITNGTVQEANVNIKLYNNGTPIDIPITVAPLSSQIYNIPSSDKGTIENPRSQAGSITNYGVHITSDVKVTAYYQILLPCTQDVYALKGTAALGTLFYVPMIHDSYYYTGAAASYPNAYDQIDIVATENGTDVTVVPTIDIMVNGANHPAGTPLLRSLDKGQTLKIMEYTPQRTAGSPSLGGTSISATRPIAVTTTEDLIGRDLPLTGQDVIGDQIVPVSSVGKKYVVVKGYMGGSERVYMLATEPNTTITVNDGSGTNTVSPLLGAGGRYEFDMGINGRTNVGPLVVTIEADHPIYCYQVTGVGRLVSSNIYRDELGSALLPSIYSIAQKQLSYYQHASVTSDYHYLFLLFRTGAENSFTLSYEATTVPLSLTPIAVPGMSDWKAARYQPSSAMHNKMVTIRNSASMFSVGYFENNTTGGGASFGYLSAFGTLQLQDTVWKCPGESITLDGGYGAFYLWKYPDGTTTAPTSTITVADTGRYIVIVNQDPFILTDTVQVMERFLGASVHSTGGAFVTSEGGDIGGGAFTYSVDFAGQTNLGVTYEWFVNGTPAGTGATLSKTWTNEEEGTVSVVVTDIQTQCTKTLILIHRALPDNVSDAGCFVTPAPINFSIKELIATNTNDLDVLTTPLIGDVDNDGEIEILHPTRLSSTNNATVVGSITELRIYGVRVTALATPSAPQLYVKYTIPLVGIEFRPPGRNADPTHFSNNTFYTFAKVDPPHASTGKRYAAIFLATISGKLYKYIFNPLTNQYEEDHSVMFNPSNELYVGARPVLADLMGDGHVQVCILDKIYDAENLTLLATLRDNSNNPVLPTNNTLSSYSFGFISHGVFWNSEPYSKPPLVVSIDDTDGDGKKEIIAGDCVYKVNITNYSAETGNSYRLAVRANKQADLTTNIESRTDIHDGCGVIIDIDLDGRKDVVVVSRGTAGGGVGYLYAYDPLTGQVKNTTVTSVTASNSSWSGGPSFPFIGDLDNDKYPEICFGAYQNDLYAYKYNPATQAFTQFWHTSTSDNTGSIGLSLFDFEQDNQPEIVYRDNGHLYIWNGSTNPPTPVNPPITTGLASASAAEYPVVADVNGDGFADIIVTGGGDGFYGNLHIFTSAGAPWAPARSVWHMSPSQPLYINSDLTIPRYPISPTTAFPGIDETLGNGDDVRPFNNYMQQATALNKNGNYLWLAPDIKPTDKVPTYYYDAINDDLKITLEVTNIGDAIFPSPLYLAAYDGSIAVANLIAIDSLTANISPEDTVSAVFTLHDYSTLALQSIVINLNDRGQATAVQQECDDLNNDITIPVSGILMARNDTIGTITVTPVKIPVLKNDAIPSGCTPTPVIVTAPLHGTATVVNDSVLYTSTDPNFSGHDSLTYYIKCDADSSTARVYIIVQKPLSQEYVACQDAWETMGFTPISGVNLWWYDAETGGSLVKSTASDTIRRQKDSDPKQTWWAEARYGNVVFPRYKVELLMGDCDVTDPTGCAKDGTVLFREDFGGNEVSDLTPSSDSLSPGTTTYYYTEGTPSDGKYTLLKYFPHPGHSRWHAYQDHTIPGIDRGYYMLVNADENPGLFYTATISGLCQNSKLYFSAWVGNMMKSDVPDYLSERPQLRFILQDAATGDTLATFVTTEIQPESQPTWKMYGFGFITNSSAIKLSIYNDVPGGEGNDLTLDDIEVRFCAPPVTTNIAGNDTIVCSGNNLDIIGSYTEDCTFGNDLSYRWEFRHKDSVEWKTLNNGDATVNCSSLNVTDRKIEKPVQITSATKADEGYYRLLVSAQGSIDAVNCRASSDSVYVRIVDRFVAPDIRIQVCPAPYVYTIQLSSYLDSTDYSGILWEEVSPLPSFINTTTGLIQNTVFTKGTYTCKYTLSAPENSGCGSTSAKVYIRTLNNRIHGKTIDTITICSALDLSRFVNLNQIFGLELGGSITYLNDLDGVIQNNIKTFSILSNYAGAVVFNAQKAYSEAGNSYDYTYKGAAVKKFEFLYTASCITGTKQVVLIVTE
jgi:hypothetical protein